MYKNQELCWHFEVIMKLQGCTGGSGTPLEIFRIEIASQGNLQNQFSTTIKQRANISTYAYIHIHNMIWPLTFS